MNSSCLSVANSLKITRRRAFDTVRDSASAIGMKRSLLVCVLHPALVAVLPSLRAHDAYCNNVGNLEASAPNQWQSRITFGPSTHVGWCTTSSNRQTLMSFSRLMVRIDSRVSFETFGRPGWPCRTFQVQYHWNPRRCQPITVSGFTMIRAERHPDQKRDSQIQNHRSVRVSRSRLG
jgi:hypothetical protein